MIKALEEKAGVQFNISEESHFMGALGASLFALERVAGEAEDSTVCGD
jgi:activator of 2-hydroxyglutaryl-CoA dehydratase